MLGAEEASELSKEAEPKAAGGIEGDDCTPSAWSGSANGPRAEHDDGPG